MKLLKLLTLLILFALCLGSCVLIENEIESSEIAGCYLTSMPDPGSPDDNPPLVDLYVQLWEDGSGEGGFWDNPLTESNFFTWEFENDTIKFSNEFDLFDNCNYYVETNDSSSFTLKAQQGQTLIATFYLSDEVVSRVDYRTSLIVGTWNNSRDHNYIFSSDSLFQDGFATTSWNKSSIPHVIELGYGSQWAVRVVNADTVIMAGYNNILSKQP